MTTDDTPTRDPAIRVTLLPRDTNALGTIFGGKILSLIDQAGAVEGHRQCAGRLLTVAMHEIEFHEPVFVGDLVSLYTHTVRIGRTSITIKVEVEAERRGSQSRGPQRTVVKVTEAEVVFVQVDENNRPIPIERGATGTEAGES